MMISKAEAWNIFTPPEDREPFFRDLHGRIPAGSARHDIFRPQVSEYLFAEGFRPQYPGGHPFAVCLSHDVDMLYNHDALNAVPSYYAGFDYIKKITSYELKRRLGLLRAKSKTIFRDWDLERTLEWHSQQDIRSSFYFLSLGLSDKDFNYDTNDIKGQLDLVKKAGSEIGLHGGHTAYMDANRLLSEKQGLEDSAGVKIKGYRNHFLKFDPSQTWQHLMKSGFVYDTTYGYADSVGFRNGMCYPFHPYHPATENFLSILEIPLQIMDVCLNGYMRMNEAQSFEVIKKIVQSVKAVNGVVTLLWHNNMMTGESGKFYSRLLSYLKNEGALFMTGEELAKHWEQQQYGQKINSMLGGTRNNP